MAEETYTFERRAQAIAQNSACRYHVNELAMAKKLCLDGGDEVDSFIKRFKGAKWRSNPDPYKVQIDFQDYHADNILHLHSQKFGKKKRCDGYLASPTPNVASESGTYYSFGRATEGHEVILLKTQLDIVRHVTGTHKSLQKGASKQSKQSPKMRRRTTPSVIRTCLN